MKKEKLIIVGGFHETIELAQMLDRVVVGIIDSVLHGSYEGYPVLGSDEDAPKIFKEFPKVPVFISVDSPALRLKLSEYYKRIGFVFTSLVSPRAIVSPSARIGTGVVVQNGAHISANSVIDDFVKVNTCVNVTHDCVIGSYSTLAPSAVVLGYANIGKLCYIGANATVLPYKHVADGTTIGAGAVVTKNTQDNITMIGVPAKPFDKRT